MNSMKDALERAGIVDPDKHTFSELDAERSKTKPKPKPRKRGLRKAIGSDSLVYVPHSGRVRESELAVLFNVEGRDTWIPKRLLEDESDDLVAVPRWFAEHYALPDWERE